MKISYPVGLRDGATGLSGQLTYAGERSEADERAGRLLALAA